MRIACQRPDDLDALRYQFRRRLELPVEPILARGSRLELPVESILARGGRLELPVESILARGTRLELFVESILARGTRLELFVEAVLPPVSAVLPPGNRLEDSLDSLESLPDLRFHEASIAAGLDELDAPLARDLKRL